MSGRERVLLIVGPGIEGTSLARHIFHHADKKEGHQ
jgi:hypothetical protein